MYCPSCGRVVENDSKFCDYCGGPMVKVSPRATTATVFKPKSDNYVGENNTRMFKKSDVIDSYELFAKSTKKSLSCERCGASIPEGNLFCERCGARVTAQNDNFENGGERIFSDSNNSYKENNQNEAEVPNEVDNTEPQSNSNCCPNCGNVLERDSRFCVNCGFALAKPENEIASAEAEPIPEPVPEPIPAPVPEPIPEPVPEPVAEPAPEPVQEPATEPEAEIYEELPTKPYIKEAPETAEDVDEPAEAHCKQCGAKLQADSVFCHICGRELDNEEKQCFCTKCGAKLIDGAFFCHRCGAKL